MNVNDDLCFSSAVSLVAAIRARQLSPVELTEAVLHRIEQVNPHLNAYVTVAAETALSAARAAEQAVMDGSPVGPLHGVPISFKDLTPTAGIRTTSGSRIFEHHVPAEDAVVVERARQAGAVMIGKTNTPEFGCKAVTDNRVFGATRNPWRLDRVAGGSSGGAGAAVAAGLSPLAEGSDLGGSIRVPASCCGVVGFKPSIGRVPRYPNANGYTGFSVVGPLARTVADAALLFAVLAGPDDRDPQSLPASGEDFARAGDGGVRGLRVAWSPDLGYAHVDPEVREIAARAALRFVDLGCRLDEEAPGFDNPDTLYQGLTAPLRAANLGAYVDQWRDEMDPLLVARIQLADRLTAVEFEQLTMRRTQLWQVTRRFFERYDLLLTPTTAVAPFPIGRDHPAEIDGHPVTSPTAWYAFTFPFNITGQPAISVPAGWTNDGLPVGLQIVGRRLGDALVLRAAAAYERIAPWAERRPPIGEPPARVAGGGL